MDRTKPYPLYFGPDISLNYGLSGLDESGLVLHLVLTIGKLDMCME